MNLFVLHTPSHTHTHTRVNRIFPYLSFGTSLGCGVGYGYLHMIPHNREAALAQQGINIQESKERDPESPSIINLQEHNPPVPASQQSLTSAHAEQYDETIPSELLDLSTIGAPEFPVLQSALLTDPSQHSLSTSSSSFPSSPQTYSIDQTNQPTPVLASEPTLSTTPLAKQSPFATQPTVTMHSPMSPFPTTTTTTAASHASVALPPLATRASSTVSSPALSGPQHHQQPTSPAFSLSSPQPRPQAPLSAPIPFSPSSLTPSSPSPSSIAPISYRFAGLPSYNQTVSTIASPTEASAAHPASTLASSTSPYYPKTMSVGYSPISSFTPSIVTQNRLALAGSHAAAAASASSAATAAASSIPSFPNYSSGGARTTTTTMTTTTTAGHGLLPSSSSSSSAQQSLADQFTTISLDEETHPST